MLRLSLPITLVFAGLLVFSCTEDTDPAIPVSGIDVEELVEEYNSELGDVTPESGEGFVSTGTITDAVISTNAEGEEQLTFTFTDQEARRTFEFFSEADVEFPQAIDRAKVVYLGHQMIVADLDGEFFVHLLVPKGEGRENLLPQLPYIEGKELELETDRKIFSQLLPGR